MADTDSRLFISGVLWVLPLPAGTIRRSAAARGKTLHKRFSRASKAGTWDRVFADLTKDRGNQVVMLDRLWCAHQQAATGKRGLAADLERFRGRLTTEVHGLADTFGRSGSCSPPGRAMTYWPRPWALFADRPTMSAPCETSPARSGQRRSSHDPLPISTIPRASQCARTAGSAAPLRRGTHCWHASTSSHTGYRPCRGRACRPMGSSRDTNSPRRTS